MSEPDSKFEEWLRQASLPDLKAELQTLVETFNSKAAEYRRLDEELDALNSAIIRRQRVVDLLEEYEPDEGEPTTAPKTKPEIAFAVLDSSPKPLFPREVRDKAVERGWLPDDPRASNQLSVAMNKMAHQGRLAKDDEGRYSIPRIISNRPDEDDERIPMILGPDGTSAPAPELVVGGDQE
jgi:hypothetical protein